MYAKSLVIPHLPPHRGDYRQYLPSIIIARKRKGGQGDGRHRPVKGTPFPRRRGVGHHRETDRHVRSTADVAAQDRKSGQFQSKLLLSAVTRKEVSKISNVSTLQPPLTLSCDTTTWPGHHIHYLRRHGACPVTSEDAASRIRSVEHDRATHLFA